MITAVVILALTAYGAFTTVLYARARLAGDQVRPRRECPHRSDANLPCILGEAHVDRQCLDLLANRWTAERRRHG